MEELAKAITHLVNTGAPLGQTAITWYFTIKLIDTIATDLMYAAWVYLVWRLGRFLGAAAKNGGLGRLFD